MMTRTSWWVVALWGLGLAALLSGCWTARSVVAPSETVAYVLVKKSAGARSRLVRCEQGKGCAVLYDTRGCDRRSGGGEVCAFSLPGKVTP